MRRSKGKFGHVLFGILIGILVSVSILWWKGNNPFKDIHLFKNVKSYFSDLFPKSTNDNNITSAEKTTENKIKKPMSSARNIRSNPDSAYFDTTSIDFYDQNALDEFLAAYGGKIPDSIKIDSVFKNQKVVDYNDYHETNNSQEVKKDKLLFVLTYKISGINQLSGNSSDMADSLLIENTNSKIQDNSLKVEFWKSPVNYKGYKTGKNKVILFGLNTNDKVSFKVLNKTLYMRHQDLFYQIDFTYDFKSFSPITNNQIISQLNK